MYLFTGIILSLLTYFFSDTIISVMFGEKFSESAMILKLFSITILLWPMVMFSGLVILAFNRYNYILIISVTSMVLSLIFSLIFINLFGITGTGMVLPFVAVGTIIISYVYLSKISKDENFRLNEIFYPANFAAGIKEMLRKSS